MRNEEQDGSRTLPEAAPLEILERCSVLFFLQVQQLATVRDTLQNEDWYCGPKSLLDLLAHMKKEIQEQSAEVRAFQRAQPSVSLLGEPSKSPSSPVPPSQEQQ